VVGFNTDSPEVWDLLDRRGWALSCSYSIREKGSGGIYHDIHYDGEVLAMDFRDLAIVKNPRYQEAREQLNESDVDTNFNNNSNMIVEQEEKNSSDSPQPGEKSLTLEHIFELLSKVAQRVGVSEERLNESAPADQSVEDFLVSKGLSDEEIERVRNYYRRGVENPENGGEPRATEDREIEKSLGKEIRNSSPILFRGEELQRNDNFTAPEDLKTRSERIIASRDKFRISNNGI
jgi:hypothetical protein